MTNNIKDYIYSFILVFGIAFGGTALLWKDAAAQTQFGGGKTTVWLGTASSASESLGVGTGNNRALSDSVVGSIVIGSATNGNVLFTLYDSSNSALTGKYVIGTFSCSAPNQFTLNQAVQYGIWIVNTGCKAVMTYLTHK